LWPIASSISMPITAVRDRLSNVSAATLASRITPSVIDQEQGCRQARQQPPPAPGAHLPRGAQKTDQAALRQVHGA
jgi:hypothetical protein